ncbi:MAG: helix-turn-helix transcriptional regulator [Rhodospirillaceae bacterium]|jgi:DNA-binding HxlR family transcriptional regulator|nr:helix-turn-helix transcriptional regulator [Rhodospirillaceae bacterium]MBT7953742.1 helix-turn-helix transcriptional regulator [Rhodospirillaceae bacterium]
MTPEAEYKNLPAEEIRALEESRPFQKILVRISNKWNVLIIRRLSGRRMRPSALRREIGNISPKVLTQTLRELESYGLIEREVFPVIPPKVEYRLTAMGDSLVVALDALRDWAMDNNAAVETSIDAYNQRQDEDDLQNF